MKHIFALAMLIVFLSASASFAADPLKVHESGFGPEINGLRLGKSMTWPEMLSIQQNISYRYGPDGLLMGSPNFGLIIADNYQAAVHKWTFEKFPSDLPGAWIVVSFGPVAGQADVSNSGGGIASKIPDSGSLDDLFAILKENGLNYVGSPNITLRDERVIEYLVDKEDLPTEAVTAADFAQWLSNAYSLGTMEQKGQDYEVSHPTEGWRVVATENKATIFSMPTPDNAQK
jgi:hypothetical protein